MCSGIKMSLMDRWWFSGCAGLSLWTASVVIISLSCFQLFLDGEGENYGEQEAGPTSSQQLQEHCETETKEPWRKEQQPHHCQSPLWLQTRPGQFSDNYITVLRPLHSGCVTTKWHKNAICSDAKYLDQNSSHRQWHEFATKTQKYEFVKEFWQPTLKREKWAHMLQILY